MSLTGLKFQKDLCGLDNRSEPWLPNRITHKVLKTNQPNKQTPISRPIRSEPLGWGPGASFFKAPELIPMCVGQRTTDLGRT